MPIAISDFPRPLRQTIRVDGRPIDIPQIGSLDQIFIQLWSAVYSLSGRSAGGAVLSGPLNLGQNRLFGLVNQARPADDEALAYETAQALYAPSVMAVELSILGPSPLNVQGLHGVLADPQLAGVPVVDALPDPNFAHTDQIVTFNNILYRFDTTTEPGAWKVLTTSGILNFGLFANRPAQPQPAGIEYLASDRGWLYYSTGAVWNYEYGAMFDTRATRVGLAMAAGDAGALFYETDTGWLYRYSGAAWAYRWGICLGSNAARLALAIGAADNGALLFTTDTAVLWQVQGGAWTQITPNIATADLLDQAAAIGATTLFTPAVSGLYRIRAYAVCTTAGAGTVSTLLTWRDDAQAQQMNVLGDFSLAGLGFYVQSDSVIRATAGNPVQYSTTIAGLGGAPRYALFIHAEAG